MRKIFLIFGLSTLLFISCEPMQKTIEAKLSIDRIVHRAFDTGWFSFYIDEPAELETKYIYISPTDDRDPESGALCNNPRSPYTCNVDFKYPSYLIKISYVDSSVSITEVAIPKPEEIEEPTIINPSEKPAQNSKLEMAFKDVGANSYEIRVANCKEYNNDGISPCLDYEKYEISVENGKASSENASVEIKDGLIILKSNFEINFEDMMTYEVLAIKSTDESHTESNASLSYYKE